MSLARLEEQIQARSARAAALRQELDGELRVLEGLQRERRERLVKPVGATAPAATEATDG